MPVPTYRFLEIPTPPEVIMEPVAVDDASVVLLVLTTPVDVMLLMDAILMLASTTMALLAAAVPLVIPTILPISVSLIAVLPMVMDLVVATFRLSPTYNFLAMPT